MSRSTTSRCRARAFGDRAFDVTVDGGSASAVALTGTSWTGPADHTMQVSLSAGENTIKFCNDTAYAPDLPEITVSG